MKIRFFTIIIAISTLLTSCENKLDLEDNWIKIKRYENTLDSEGLMIESDTINAKIGDEFKISIYSQHQPECELTISERVNDNSLNNISDFPEGACLKGYYEENGIQRKIHEIKVSLSQSIFNSGDRISYYTEIKTPSEVKVQRELLIKIE